MTSEAFSLHSAIFAVIQPVLSEINCGIYDHVPQDAPFPYVSIDSQQSVERDFLSSRLDERSIYLSIWSDYQGQKQVLEIISAITGALHNVRLDVSDACVTVLKVKNTRSLMDADGATYTGKMTLSCMMTYS